MPIFTHKEQRRRIYVELATLMVRGMPWCRMDAFDRVEVNVSETYGEADPDWSWVDAVEPEEFVKDGIRALNKRRQAHTQGE